MSKRVVPDVFAKLAKGRGYPARSVFKLEEIDKKYRLFNNRKHMRVVDLGCNPGSWTKYAAKQIGPKGIVYAIDRRPPPPEMAQNVISMQIDVLEWGDVDTGLHGNIDVVLSDMAPNTTGQHDLDASMSLEMCCAASRIADIVLKDDGVLLMKVLEGGNFSEMLRTLRAKYGKVHVIKPKSSRKESSEVFVMGDGLKDRAHLNEDDYV